MNLMKILKTEVYKLMINGPSRFQYQLKQWLNQNDIESGKSITKLFIHPDIALKVKGIGKNEPILVSRASSIESLIDNMYRFILGTLPTEYKSADNKKRGNKLIDIVEESGVVIPHTITDELSLTIEVYDNISDVEFQHQYGITLRKNRNQYGHLPILNTRPAGKHLSQLSVCSKFFYFKN